MFFFLTFQSDTPERKLSSIYGSDRLSSLEGDEANAVAGGIGAALSQYDGLKRIVSSNNPRRLARPASAGFGLNKFGGRGHGSSNDVALSPSLAAKTNVIAGTEPPEHLQLPPGAYLNLSEDGRVPVCNAYGSAGYFVGSLSGSPAHAPSFSQLVCTRISVLCIQCTLWLDASLHFSRFLIYR